MHSRPRAALTAGVLLAVWGATACSPADQPADRAAGRTAESPVTEGTVTEGTSAVTPEPTESAQSTESAEPSAGTTTGSPTEPPTGSPSGAAPTPTGGGAEMPPVDAATRAPQRPRPPRTGSSALVGTPLPAAASATGSLVPGFPRALRPLGRSRVSTSSVSPDGTRLHAALEATTPAAEERVLLALRTRFARLGMTEESVRTVDGAESVAFARGGSSVVVTTRRGAGGTTYTLFGVLRTDG